jgi:hypothetical protein
MNNKQFEQILQEYKDNIILNKVSQPKFINNIPNDKIIDLSYHTQLNNQDRPYTACNITALNTIIDYIGINKTDDEISYLTQDKDCIDYVNKMIKSWGEWVRSYILRKTLRELWLVLEWVGNKLIFENNINLRFYFVSRNLDWIYKCIDVGMPVIIGLNKKINGASFGHYITIVGYQKQKDGDYFIVHDPFGNWYLNYAKDIKGNNISGKYVKYPVKNVIKSSYSDRMLICL